MVLHSFIPYARLYLGSADCLIVGMEGALCLEMGFLLEEDQHAIILIIWCIVVIKCDLHLLCIFWNIFRYITSLVLNKTCDMLMAYILIFFFFFYLWWNWNSRLKDWVSEFGTQTQVSCFFFFVQLDSFIASC